MSLKRPIETAENVPNKIQKIEYSEHYQFILSFVSKININDHKTSLIQFMQKYNNSNIAGNVIDYLNIITDLISYVLNELPMRDDLLEYLFPYMQNNLHITYDCYYKREAEERMFNIIKINKRHDLIVSYFPSFQFMCNWISGEQTDISKLKCNQTFFLSYVSTDVMLKFDDLIKIYFDNNLMNGFEFVYVYNTADLEKSNIYEIIRDDCEYRYIKQIYYTLFKCLMERHCKKCGYVILACIIYYACKNNDEQIISKVREYIVSNNYKILNNIISTIKKCTLNSYDSSIKKLFKNIDYLKCHQLFGLLMTTKNLTKIVYDITKKTYIILKKMMLCDNTRKIEEKIILVLYSDLSIDTKQHLFNCFGNRLPKTTEEYIVYTMLNNPINISNKPKYAISNIDRFVLINCVLSIFCNNEFGILESILFSYNTLYKFSHAYLEPYIMWLIGTYNKKNILLKNESWQIIEGCANSNLIKMTIHNASLI
jgi:hypothetical protein